MKSAIQVSLFFLISFILLFNSVPLYPESKESAINKEITQKKIVSPEERTEYLVNQCSDFLKKFGWITTIDGSQIMAFRLGGRYDEMLLKIETVYDAGLYNFTVAISKNGVQTQKVLRLPGSIVSDDSRLREHALSVVVPFAAAEKGIGDFRRAFSSIFSFGYSRTHDGREFFPAYAKGNLHLSWQLEYDPSARILLRDTTLAFGDYTAFNVYLDWASIVRENFFNIDLLIYGKNKYFGSAEHGTRFMYGFFNGLEYFRPGFSDSTMKWDRPVTHTQPYIQYAIWRALQLNMLISRRNGPALYSAGIMLGAGMGVGPSSLFYAGITEEEEQDMSPAFRSIKYRKQNYYFSYTLPVRLVLCADHVYGFRFEAGYNYYFFFPVISDDLYDMLHIFKGSMGYYITSDVIMSIQYERWKIESMLYDKTRTHDWNRLIIEFRNYF